MTPPNATNAPTHTDEPALRGFIYLTSQPDGRVLVDNLHAHPAHVGTGIGHRLLHAGFAWAAANYPGQNVWLNVFSSNARAIAFYERQGGRCVGEHVITFRGSELPEREYVWPADYVDERAKKASSSSDRQQRC
ncbi:GNAT family N-acetyltransferase [Streptomyces flaveus]|uniref:GNAT family N-acetyltransferase n=1 Tax=Streptomyces flaveus TaxID=66370 RepID=UPI00331AF405